MMIYRRVPLSFINMFTSIWWFTGEYHYPLLICLYQYDDLQDSTIKVIWSFHPDEPTSFDTLTWHGADRRGAKSLMLLSSVNANNFVQPPDAQHFDMLHHHVRYSSVNIVDWLINWLVFNANFNNISAISWHV